MGYRAQNARDDDERAACRFVNGITGARSDFAC
jgi:hypothetical protein